MEKRYMDGGEAWEIRKRKKKKKTKKEKHKKNERGGE